MNFKTGISAVFTILVIAFQANAQDINSTHPSKALFDRYGREIRSVTGDKKNYPNDLQLMSGKEDTPVLTDQLPFNGLVPGSVDSGCDPFWKQGIMGTCIGVNSMISDDIDNDGKTEIICSGGSGFGSGNFWYILAYNEVTGNYDQEWISEWYGDYQVAISLITVLDIDNDQVMEIYVGRKNGSIEVYNGQTLELIRVISGFSEDAVYQVLWVDADNDGAPELVYCTDNQTFLLNSADFTLKRTVGYGAGSMEFGNVDGGSASELVYSSGQVVRLTSTQASLEWEFQSNANGRVGVTDLDGDGMQEIVFAGSWYYIDIYDADTRTLKYKIDSDLDIDALQLADVNGDGKKEILYGDGQWGNIYCHNAANGQLMWSVQNPEHGTTAVNVADTDNDGILELMWGAGCSSTGSDYIFIHEIPSMEAEWKSVHIDGPFYAVKIADVDDDGEQEIITLSYESESGYDSGILTVFNGTTYEIEWQCNETFLYGCWTGMYAFDVLDVDMDGDTEIVVGAGETYDAKIWVINGLTKVMESEHEFYNADIDEFYAFTTADVDGDGNYDFIGGSSEGTYVINPADYSVKWSLTSNIYNRPSRILAGNIDNDPAAEIVRCAGRISVIDGLSHASWETTQSDFTNIDLFDYNNDGKTDIIASTSAGYIGMIDGETREITWIISDFGARIDGVKVLNLVGTPEPDIVFTSAGIVSFLSGSGGLLQTGSFGTVAGAYSGLATGDLNGDGKKEVIVGTNYQVVAIGPACYRCVDFVLESSVENVSCLGGNDGSVSVDAIGGQAPYTYTWSNGGNTAGIQNLAPGTYSVTVTDSQGCSQEKTLSVVQSELIAEIDLTNVGCNGLNNGTASVSIIAGSPPYTYLWNNGSSAASLQNLPVGDYSVDVTDSRSCTTTLSGQVEQGSLSISVMSQDVSCNSMNDGYIQVFINHGEPPFTYNWSNGATTQSISDLMPGNYTVTVTDNLLCSKTVSVEIEKTGEITASSVTVNDDPSTPYILEGSATIIPEGGMPPYYIQWYDPYFQTSPTAVNLYPGEYTVRVRDFLGCQSYFVVFVGEVNAIPYLLAEDAVVLYPVPASGFVTLELKGEQLPSDASYRILTLQGNTLAENKISALTTNIDISKFKPGFYLIRVFANGLSGTRHLIVQ
ncbi:MAG: VCBS repeat-containing protein [Bacteroidales bacterium]|nr:VCBS repeat-containing protein [Bacteroidales bacterium]